MLVLLLLTMILRVCQAVPDETEEECADKSPYCNTNDCTVRPGYALEYCQKTCGDCEPFCHNSHFVSCKESRKPECDSMLKDYCPLLCGACRPLKKKSSKGKGSKLMSRTPLSIANLGILQKFSNAKQMPSNMSVQRPTHTLVTPATAPPSNSSNGSSLEENSSVFRSPHREEAMYPDPFVDGVEPTSTPIVADEEDSGIESEWMEQSTPTELNATHANQSFPPEPMRIPPNQPPSQRPPPHWQRPSGAFTPPWAHGPPEQALSQRRYHPAHRPAQWAEQYPQPYPPFSFASPPRPFGRALYSPAVISAHMEGIQEPPMGFGDLVTLLGCRDRDPSICTQVTQESCLSRPGYYMKLCPVKCRNCNGKNFIELPSLSLQNSHVRNCVFAGLQCLDSIKLDCAEVQRLGGCKLPTAAEYCPRTCRLCALPAAIAETLPPCKDELDTCENLAESGVCEHPYSRKALRIYCAKSCGFCREPQYYMNDVPYLSDVKAKERLRSLDQSAHLQSPKQEIQWASNISLILAFRVHRGDEFLND
ncbi:hypothetical protein ANCCAN_01397 [Ancylostoma caninum]|uniref:ShKT domain-containing protein n=1 Tax=Ancylostoma caninum TaxID=29170 RepID=A0A368HAS7_ANCCA|nr:hypothetical protein ANCCAN_01397 [Ancylostoma caninum]